MSLFTQNQDGPQLGEQKWETPPAIFYQLDHEFCFTLDPCATAGNAKCAKFFTEEQDGLRMECNNWPTIVKCNRGNFQPFESGDVIL